MLKLQKIINLCLSRLLCLGSRRRTSCIEKAVTIGTSRVLVLAYAQINLALCHCDLEFKSSSEPDSRLEIQVAARRRRPLRPPLCSNRGCSDKCDLKPTQVELSLVCSGSPAAAARLTLASQGSVPS